MAAAVADDLSRGVPPDSIVATTFTRAAAAELSARIERYASGVGGNGILVCTWHALARLIVDRYGGAGLVAGRRVRIYDDFDVESLIRETCFALKVKPGPVIDKAALIWSTDALEMLPFEIRRPLGVVRDSMKSEGALDQEGLIYEAAEVLRRDPAQRSYWAWRARNLYVDEVQDFTHAEHVLLGAIKWVRLCAVGDPAQNLYEWRGAIVRGIEILAETARSSGGAVFSLTGCFRTGEAIVRGFWNPCRERIEPGSKQTESLRLLPPGIENPMASATWKESAADQNDELGRLVKDAHGDVCILARTHDSLNRAIDFCAAVGIRVVRLERSRLWDGAGARFVRYMMRLLFDADDPAARRGFAFCVATANLPRRETALRETLPKVGPLIEMGPIWAWFREFAPELLRFGAGWALTEVAGIAARCGRDLGKTVERLSEPAHVGETPPVPEDPFAQTWVYAGTVHAAKGLEWPTVVLWDLSPNVWPRVAKNSAGACAERRVLYVGGTRARDRLEIIGAVRLDAANKPEKSWLLEETLEGFASVAGREE